MKHKRKLHHMKQNNSTLLVSSQAPVATISKVSGLGPTIQSLEKPSNKTGKTNIQSFLNCYL
ncbi:hypothetical protein EUTSA_v10005248mg [Eutrema salsugineum]|uniref:Uncharacterized protein n=1 Tax=Eutrema salsugineum TaxID=72664 RepID=V4KT22_EUTSA|nr:hypothetical protein EUTSA_v10005248mg [Eutrema salsugineum]ESQ33167.1 hypothetical protein EUTSA_v10005248mg [Eutrema salsugineum]